MGENETTDPQRRKIDYSAVTPATGTDPDNIQIAESLANHMPTADSPPPVDGSTRSDPDKIIPGPEAASSVDAAEEEQIEKNIAEDVQP